MSRGKATSGAPIISGSMKFPIVAGIDGTRKNHTMMMPWIVNRRLYSSEVRNSPVGLTSSSRTSAMAMPPMKKNTVIDSA